MKITVGPPFFNRVNAPLGVALLLLMGIGPLVAWRRASLRHLVETFLAPTGSGMAGAPRHQASTARMLTATKSPSRKSAAACPEK